MENNIRDKFEILRLELSLTQGQMDKYDQISTTIKTWMVTVWAASTGWAFQVNRKEIFLLSAVIISMFWFFDIYNKIFRQDYKKRRDEVANELSKFFKDGTISQSTISPKLPTHNWKDVFKNVTMLHISLPYIVLILISILLFVR